MPSWSTFPHPAREAAHLEAESFLLRFGKLVGVKTLRDAQAPDAVSHVREPPVARKCDLDHFSRLAALDRELDLVSSVGNLVVVVVKVAVSQHRLVVEREDLVPREHACPLSDPLG